MLFYYVMLSLFNQLRQAAASLIVQCQIRDEPDESGNGSWEADGVGKAQAGLHAYKGPRSRFPLTAFGNHVFQVKQRNEASP